MADITVGYDAAGNALDHTTLEAAWTAASAGDTLQVYYADANKATHFWGLGPNNGADTTKAVSIIGMLSGRRVTFRKTISTNAWWYSLDGDLSGNSGETLLQNFTLMGARADTNYDGVYWHNSGVASGGLVVDNVHFAGGFSIGLRCREAGKVTAKNCLFTACNIGFRHQLAGYAYFCTALGCNMGYQAGNQAGTFKNCLAAMCQACFGNTGSATGNNNASTDATAADGNWSSGSDNISGKDPDDLDFWRDNANDLYPEDYRILTSSDLHGAGVAVSGITTDCDGNSRNDPPSIGWHEGTATPFGITHPVAGDVHDTAGTFEAWSGTITPSYAPDFPARENVLDDDTVQGLAGLFANIAAAQVVLGQQWGANGTEFTGAYSADFPDVGNVLDDDTVNGSAGTFANIAEAHVVSGQQWGANGTEFTGAYSAAAPTEPTLVVSNDENGTTATATISGSDGGTTNTVYVAEYGSDNWDAGTQRSGDGTVTLTPAGGTGHYWAYCESADVDASALTQPVEFSITGASPVFLPEEALRVLLLADADVAAVVSARMYAEYAPETATLPYLVYNRISTQRAPHFTAASNLAYPRIQVDCYAATWSEAKNLADKCRLAADGYSGTVTGAGGALVIQRLALESDGDGFTPPAHGSDTGYVRVTLDFSMAAEEIVPTF